MKFHVERQIWSECIAIRMLVRDKVAKNITFEKHNPGEYTDPFLTLELEQAQELIDRMYAAGLRPSAAAGSAGQLDAVKYHLEDMRKIAMRSLS